MTAPRLQGGMKAWGEHYAIHAITETADLAIYQVSRPARGCLSYVIASDGKAIVIDPLAPSSSVSGFGARQGIDHRDRDRHARPRRSHQRRHAAGRQDWRALLSAPLRRDSSHGRASGDDPVRVHSRRPALSRGPARTRRRCTFPVTRSAWSLSDWAIAISSPATVFSSVPLPARTWAERPTAWAPLHGRSLRRLLGAARRDHPGACRDTSAASMKATTVADFARRSTI